MLASRNHNQVEKIEGRRPERGDSTSYTKTASEQNPLWQSHAMRTGALRPKLTVGQADDDGEPRPSFPTGPSLLRDLTAASLDPTATGEILRGGQAADCLNVSDASRYRDLQTGRALSRPLQLRTRAAFRPLVGDAVDLARISETLPSFVAAAGPRAAAFGTRIATTPGLVREGQGISISALAHELVHVAQHIDGGPAVHFKGGAGEAEADAVSGTPRSGF